MPVSLSMSTAGGDEIATAFAAIKRATDDMFSRSEAGPAVARKLRQQIRYHFSGEGATGYAGAWAALSPAYAEWKSKHYPGAPILQLTGRLHGSLVDGSHAEAIEIFDRTYLFVGSEVEYAGYHQSGTGRMPRRPPISPTDRDVAEWVAEIHRHFDRNVMKGYGTGQRVSTRRALVGA
jgi:phage gpG-like protein